MQLHTGITNKMEAAWFRCSRFAVVGASKDRNKFGNKCFRALLKHKGDGGAVVPVHFKERSIEGVDAVTLEELLLSSSDDPSALAINIVAPPAVTCTAVQAALAAGVTQLWLQPGAESPEVFEIAAAAGATLIAGGPCVLVALGEPDSF